MPFFRIPYIRTHFCTDSTPIFVPYNSVHFFYNSVNSVIPYIVAVTFKKSIKKHFFPLPPGSGTENKITDPDGSRIRIRNSGVQANLGQEGVGGYAGAGSQLSARLNLAPHLLYTWG